MPGFARAGPPKWRSPAALALAALAASPGFAESSSPNPPALEGISSSASWTRKRVSNFEKKNLRSTPFGLKKLQMAMEQKENPEKGPQVFFLFPFTRRVTRYIWTQMKTTSPRSECRTVFWLVWLSWVVWLSCMVFFLASAETRPQGGAFWRLTIGPPLEASEFSEAQKKSFYTSLVVFIYLKASKKSLQKAPVGGCR